MKPLGQHEWYGLNLFASRHWHGTPTVCEAVNTGEDPYKQYEACEAQFSPPKLV